MELLTPTAALCLLAVPAIVILYLVRARGPEVDVASHLLWARHLSDRQANAPWKKLRSSPLLWVQVLVAAALALALMRPGFAGASGVSGTTVVLIDGSPSMLATDVEPSRFSAAVDRARQLAGQLRPGQQMAVVLLGRHPRLLTPATGDTRDIRAALTRARPSGEAANLAEGISLANSLLRGRSEGSVVLLSDGHMRRPETPPRLSAPLRYESFGRTGENAAIDSIGRTPEGDVFVRVSNLGSTAKDLNVELRADGRLVDLLPMRVEESSSFETVWPRLPVGTGVLEARLTPDDDFAVDDRAWLLTEGRRESRVLLVSRGNGFLSRALGLRPGTRVTTSTPEVYQAQAGGGRYDLYVFDGFVPPGPLPTPALVVAPPRGAGPVPAGDAVDPGPLLPANPREPLLQYVSLRDVHVRSASAVSPPSDWRTVVAAANGPLLLAHLGEPRMAQLNFDIHESDLPLRAAFPVLMQNLLSFLLPASFEDQVLPLGEAVPLGAGTDTSSLDVTTPDGRRVGLRGPFPATFGDTANPGVYTVREVRAGQTVASRFVVQLQDPAQSRIAPGPRPEVRVESRTGRDAPRGTLEIWPWVVALALLGLVAEWALFLRG